MHVVVDPLEGTESCEGVGTEWTRVSRVDYESEFCLQRSSTFVVKFGSLTEVLKKIVKKLNFLRRLSYIFTV